MQIIILITVLVLLLLAVAIHSYPRDFYDPYQIGPDPEEFKLKTTKDHEEKE